MDERQRRRLSKRLSYHLRHGPGDAGVVLDPAGWVEVGALLTGLGRTGRPVTRARLEEVVARDDRRRFELSPDGRRIRARYGHSVDVDPGHEPVAEPPAVLYHGTTPTALAGIRRRGLVPRGRRHVHLSGDAASARRVGARHGRPVVLEVDAVGLVAEGHALARAAPDVWLVDHVPPRHLTLPDDEAAP